MIEKKFISNIYKFSIINLNNGRDFESDEFFSYFKMIINNSHIFVKIGYFFLLYFFFIFYFMTAILLLPKKIEFRIFILLVNFLKKIPFISEVFKFIKIHSLIFKYD